MTAGNTSRPKNHSGDDLFRLLVEGVQDYAIFNLDDHGIVMSWNAGAMRIKGYHAEEIIGHHFSRFYPEEAIRTGWPQTELEGARRDGRFEDEGWRVRKDGSQFWANVVITALYDEHGTSRGFAKITRDLTERRRVERLEADAHQVSDFVAMLAHELRNPLAPIRNAVMLAQNSADQSRVQRALAVIDRQTAHMARLVDDLLDVSRITRGLVRLERRRVHLRGIVDAAIEALRYGCEQKGQTLQVGHQTDAWVRGDAVRLAQVITNLVGNAIKYTPDRGRIDVLVRAEGASVQIVVRDTGIGISPDLLPLIFDIFSQDLRSLDRSQGGLGLGLTIARRLVEMHRGTLVARSAGPGCGSEFVLTLDTVESTPGLSDGAVVALVVDDNADAAICMQELLQMHGHLAHVAFDGDAALKAARSLLPDVILLDIGLPRMNGYEVARAIRGIPELEGVTLVAITGYNSKEDRARSSEAGFDAHIAKPVDYAVLQRMVPVLAGVDEAPT
jgi:PAS domain S-box-containing protein